MASTFAFKRVPVQHSLCVYLSPYICAAAPLFGVRSAFDGSFANKGEGHKHQVQLQLQLQQPASTSTSIGFIVVKTSTLCPARLSSPHGRQPADPSFGIPSACPRPGNRDRNEMQSRAWLCSLALDGAPQAMDCRRSISALPTLFMSSSSCGSSALWECVVVLCQLTLGWCPHVLFPFSSFSACPP